MHHPISLQQQRKVWIVHQSLNGSTYFFNRASKKSQYQMPQCFKITQQQLEHPQWRQYRTAQGKKFFYNAISKKTSLIMPHQVKQYKLKKQQQRKKIKQANGGVLPVEQKLSETQQNKKLFMTMLKHRVIQINTKWDSCVKLCEDDDRWNLLKISQKKKYFNQYLNNLKKESQKAKKQKTQQNKALFLKMLKQSRILTSQSKMHKVAPDFTTDSRWRLLQGTQRQNVFQQHLDDLVARQKQQAKQNKRLNSEHLRRCMQDDNIKYNTKWDQFCEMYQTNPYFNALLPYDRITTFVDYIFQMEKKHEQDLIKQKKLKERENRINFRKMLRDKLSSGQISYKIKWKNFVKDYREEPTLLAMMDPQQPGTSAHQIFEHVLDQVRDNHKNIKGQIKHHFKKKGFKMNQETTNEQFMEKVQDLQPFAILPHLLKQYFYSYFQHKIKSKNNTKTINNAQSAQLDPKKKEKKQRKIIFKIFRQLNIDPDNKYAIDDYMEKIQKDLKQYLIQMSRQNILKCYLQFLSGAAEEEKRRKKDNNNGRKDDSSNSDSDSNKDKGKRKRKQTQEQKQKLRKDVLKMQNSKDNAKEITKISINNNESENEQQGQIKDEQIEERQRKKNKSKKNRKKRSKSKSSSDSD